jgi:hypothetical protein
LCVIAVAGVVVVLCGTRHCAFHSGCAKHRHEQRGVAFSGALVLP